MPVYLSASSISDFIACPQKVLWRITKPFPEIKSPAMVKGTIAHYALEKGWKDRERALTIVRQECKKEELMTRKELLDLEFMMDIFFLNFRGLVGDNDLIEYRFKIPLHDDVFIVGKIDRISDGNLIDWKTAGKLPSRLSNDVQCIIYDWAYKKLFDREAKSICIASLAKGDLIPYVKDDFYTKEIFNNIIPRMIRTVKNQTYERLGMFNHSCFMCPYKIGCLERTEHVLDNPEFVE